MGGGDSQYRLELDAELGVEQMLRVMSCHVMDNEAGQVVHHSEDEI